METDLLRKLPLRQHMKNIRKILKLVYRLDGRYFRETVLVQMMSAAQPYLALILSAYVLDGLSAGKSFSQLMTVISISLFTILLMHYLRYAMDEWMRARWQNTLRMYGCITQIRLLDLDFSRIASPEMKEIQDRIRSDNQWGPGLNGIYWNLNNLVLQCFRLLGAIILAAPVVGYMVGGGRYEVLGVFGALVTIITAGQHIVALCRKKVHYHQFSTIKEEEKEERYCFSWEFANNEAFAYQYGKDIRIYHSYDLFKRWTTEVFGHSAFRGRILDMSKGWAGEFGFSGMMSSAASGGAYLMVALVALGGTVTVGSVLQLAGALSGLFSSFYEIVNALSGLAQTARQQMSVLELLELEDEMYKGKLPMEKRSDGQYQVEFRNVSFKYPGTENWALKDFSLKLTVGEKLAIVGMNGSGKTTMIKLLCRLYDPQEGEILLNGVDIRKFKQDEYCRLFSVVFQDYMLFSFPLGENVAVDGEYETEKVEQCLVDADFGERLKTLDKGVDTYLYKDYDDNGVEISGGEAQKIAIARAIYKDAPFILLDEPTAALDPLAEYEIYTNFDRIAGDKTAIYISHRLSSCRFCEKIAVFHEGRLVQLGSHEDLVADRSGKYYEMWEAQAQYYREKGIEGLAL